MSDDKICIFKIASSGVFSNELTKLHPQLVSCLALTRNKTLITENLNIEVQSILKLVFLQKELYIVLSSFRFKLDVSTEYTLGSLSEPLQTGCPFWKDVLLIPRATPIAIVPTKRSSPNVPARKRWLFSSVHAASQCCRNCRACRIGF